MRTNIVLNDELVKHAFKFSKAKTVNELIHEAPEELIAVRQRSDIRDLRGKIAFREAQIITHCARGRAVGLVDTLIKPALSLDLILFYNDGDLDNVRKIIALKIYQE